MKRWDIALFSLIYLAKRRLCWMRQVLISKCSIFDTFIHSSESMKQRNYILAWIFITMIFLRPPPLGGQYTEVNFDWTDLHDISSREKKAFPFKQWKFCVIYTLLLKIDYHMKVWSSLLLLVTCQRLSIVYDMALLNLRMHF